MNPLGRGPDREPARVPVVLGRVGVRLHRHVLNHVGLEGILQDQVALPEAFLRVADRPLHVLQEVGVPVNGRRVRLERLLGISDHGQVLVIHFDEVKGVFRGPRRGRRHGRHAVAHVPDNGRKRPLIGKEPVVVHGFAPIAVEKDVGRVLVGQDGLDARNREGLGNVDPPDPGVGDGASQDAHGQGPVHRQVRRVTCLPRHLHKGVLLLDRLSDVPEVAPVSTHPASPILFAASSMASMILMYPVHRQ